MQRNVNVEQGTVASNPYAINPRPAAIVAARPSAKADPRVAASRLH